MAVRTSLARYLSRAPAEKRGTGRPRVLYLITDPISTRLLEGQLSFLRSTGFDVEIAAASGDDLEAFGASEGVAVHALPFVREPNVRLDAAALLATVRLIRRLRPDVVNASTPKAGLLGMLAAAACRVPVRVYVIRGFRFETFEGWRRSLFMTTERIAVRCSTTTIANSRSLVSVGERARFLPAGKAVVLAGGSGNGVDVARFRDLPSPGEARGRLGLPLDAFVVGFVGRFVRDKGFNDLLEAFNGLVGLEGGIRLLLVGDYEEGDPVPPSVRARVEEDARIVRTGWLRDPASVLPAMDVLVFPSYREGLPNVPLEAQAAGVPVVAYAATGTVDAVDAGVTGQLVQVGDVEALVRAVHELERDPNLRQALGDQGQLWVEEQFSPERVRTELASLLWRSLSRAGLSFEDAEPEPDLVTTTNGDRRKDERS